jgi:hypothetical protein
MPFSESDWQTRLKQALAAGELVDEQSLVRRLGWDTRQLDAAIATHRIFFLECEGSRCFPALFCDEAYDPRQVQSVSEALGTVTAGGKWQFFSTPKGSLGGCTPLMALARGQFRAVGDAALAFAER